MFSQAICTNERPVTTAARQSFSGVLSHMIQEAVLVREASMADGAPVRIDPPVDVAVAIEAVKWIQGLPTDVAVERSVDASSGEPLWHGKADSAVIHLSLAKKKEMSRQNVRGVHCTFRIQGCKGDSGWLALAESDGREQCNGAIVDTTMVSMQ